jgi:hypothetical protein
VATILSLLSQPCCWWHHGIWHHPIIFPCNFAPPYIQVCCLVYCHPVFQSRLPAIFSALSTLSPVLLSLLIITVITSSIVKHTVSVKPTDGYHTMSCSFACYSFFCFLIRKFEVNNSTESLYNYAMCHLGFLNVALTLLCLSLTTLIVCEQVHAARTLLSSGPCAAATCSFPHGCRPVALILARSHNHASHVACTCEVTVCIETTETAYSYVRSMYS